MDTPNSVDKKVQLAGTETQVREKQAPEYRLPLLGVAGVGWGRHSPQAAPAPPPSAPTSSPQRAGDTALQPAVGRGERGERESLAYLQEGSYTNTFNYLTDRLYFMLHVPGIFSGISGALSLHGGPPALS